MKFFPALRALAYLKRATRALESIAESQRVLAAQGEERATAFQKKRVPKMAEVFTPTVENLNKLYEEDHGSRE